VPIPALAPVISAHFPCQWFIAASGKPASGRIVQDADEFVRGAIGNQACRRQELLPERRFGVAKGNDEIPIAFRERSLVV
jgi:hypothetical protein